MPSIAIIYEYGNEKWSTPWSVRQEFIRLGWTVRRYHLSKMTGLEASELVNNRPDVTLVMDWKGIDILPTLKAELSKAGSFLVREAGDTPQNYDSHLPVCNGYDLILTPDYISVEKYKRAGHHCIWWTHFTDTVILPTHPTVHIDQPVRSTRGSGSSYILDSLSGVMSDKFLNKNGMLGEEYMGFLSGGLITVQESRYKEITRRIFEGMSCKTLMLTDRLPSNTKIDLLFTEDEDIVYYDGLADCISKINYYLSEEGSADRERIIKNGYNKVMQNHTQVQRVQSIINEYNTWQKRNQ